MLMQLPIKSYRDTILESYDQISIFSHYLKLEYRIINDCISYNTKISNPLRIDKDPSFTFYVKDNKVRMWDYARAEFRGDIFDLVGLLITENPSDIVGFINICKHIINSIKMSAPFDTSNIVKFHHEVNKQKRHKTLDCTIRDYNNEDRDYWRNHFITTDFLESEKVYALQDCYIDDFLYYRYTKGNPGYVYYYGNDKDSKPLQKWYLPFEIKSRKHRTNVPYPFENIYDVKGNLILWIIKSTKDRLVIKNLLINYVKDRKVQNILPFIDFVSFTSESARLKPDTIKVLDDRYKYKLLTVDFDVTGKRTKEYYDNYNFNTKFVIDTHHKDIADFVKHNCLTASINFVKDYLLKWLLVLGIKK